MTSIYGMNNTDGMNNNDSMKTETARHRHGPNETTYSSDVIADIVESTSKVCIENQISDLVDILRYYQSKFGIGRKLDIENVAEMAEQSLRGHTEMRSNFGRHMARVMTKVNDFYYVNLNNNNPRNPGRCSLDWDEFQEFVNMKECLEQLFQQLATATSNSTAMTLQWAEIFQQGEAFTCAVIDELKI
ncbi:unnamed protein product [Mytilus coruscus]|uniref:Uncharacterized protein n=1 Tax=Mytilus coruscus TaxID=42192 RepID=A0A6J8APH2_MYTCO|nr:unnamed protein product [Mytilus coruscus]